MIGVPSVDDMPERSHCRSSNTTSGENPRAASHEPSTVRTRTILPPFSSPLADKLTSHGRDPIGSPRLPSPRPELDKQCPLRQMLTRTSVRVQFPAAPPQCIHESPRPTRAPPTAHQAVSGDRATVLAQNGRGDLIRAGARREEHASSPRVQMNRIRVPAVCFWPVCTECTGGWASMSETKDRMHAPCMAWVATRCLGAAADLRRREGRRWNAGRHRKVELDIRAGDQWRSRRVHRG